MHAEVTVAQATLRISDAAAEIDRVIATALQEHRPGYLMVPADVAVSTIAPPAAPLRLREPAFSEQAFDAFVARAREMLERARCAVVLADFLADRFGVQPQLRRLIQVGRFPHTTLSMGKGLLDETNPDFLGTYAGRASAPAVRERVIHADVVIAAGVRFTDSTTAGFTQDIVDEGLIDIQPFSARIGAERYEPLPMAKALLGLTGVVAKLGRTWHVPSANVQVRTPHTGGALSQVELWSQIEQFLQPGDIVVAEQGTAFFGVAQTRLPKGVRFIGQPLWGSVGYTLPAAYGAQIAAPDRRVVLLIGDGSAQFTAQEIGSMLRDGLKSIIVLINNGGYTIERAIQGPTERYNDIASWNWSLLPQALGAGTHALTLQADSAGGLERALATAAKADRLVFLEARVPKFEIPVLLEKTLDLIAKRNAA